MDTEDSGIMKHNAARAGAFCGINPKLHPKPSEYPPGRRGRHKVKSTTFDPGESESEEEVRQEAEKWLLLLMMLLVVSLCSPILANPPSIIQQTY